MTAKRAKAIALVDFKGVVDGEVHPTQINAGDALHGDLATAALKGGLAKEPTEKKSVTRAPANKAKTETGKSTKGKPASGGSAGKGRRRTTAKSG